MSGWPDDVRMTRSVAPWVRSAPLVARIQRLAGDRFTKAMAEVKRRSEESPMLVEAALESVIDDLQKGRWQ